MNVLIFGASGMAGHVILTYLVERGHGVQAAERGSVSDISTLKCLIGHDRFDYIINCVGVLNKFADENIVNAVYLNSLFPHLIASLIKNSKTKLIHISTDCVFSGEKGRYYESDFPDGKSIYDRSKALGEVSYDGNLTFRMSIIGPDKKPDGIGLVNWFMKQKGEISGFSKAVWTGISTITLARAIEHAMECGLSGLYHLVNNTSISKYELLILFSRIFKDSKIKVNEDDSVCVDKSLVNNRSDFGFLVPSYEEMVQEIKHWIDGHQELYMDYYFV